MGRTLTVVILVQHLSGAAGMEVGAADGGRWTAARSDGGRSSKARLGGMVS